MIDILKLRDKLLAFSLKDLVKMNSEEFEKTLGDYNLLFNNISDGDLRKLGDKIVVARAIRDNEDPEGLGRNNRTMYERYMAENRPGGRQNNNADENDEELQAALKAIKEMEEEEQRKENEELQRVIQLSELEEKQRLEDEKTYEQQMQEANRQSLNKNWVNDLYVQMYYPDIQLSEVEEKQRLEDEKTYEQQMQEAKRQSLAEAKQLKQRSVLNQEQRSVLSQLKKSGLSEQEQSSIRKLLVESGEIPDKVHRKIEKSIKRKKEKPRKKDIAIEKAAAGAENAKKVWKNVAYVMRGFFEKGFESFKSDIDQIYKNKSKRANAQANSDFEKIAPFFKGVQDDFSAFDEGPEPFKIENKRQLLDMLKMTQKYVKLIGSSDLDKNFTNLVELIKNKSIASLAGESLTQKTKKELDSWSTKFGLAKADNIQSAIQQSKSQSSVFGLDQIETIISKWIPQEASESEEVCRNAMRLKEKPRMVQKIFGKIVEEAIPFYAPFGWTEDQNKVKELLSEKIECLADASVEKIRPKKISNENEEMRKKRLQYFEKLIKK
ncbi:MAG: hypothetical protein FJX00_02305 [Alphaproteobacteria bacterium]|nr:hypothetical protein [Alphaproteobacteria bacterium]